MARILSKAEREKRALEHNHEFFVFQTGCSEEELGELIRGFGTYQSGNYYGIEVRERFGLKGMFSLFVTGHFDPCQNIANIRIVGNQVWTRGYANEVEAALRKRCIPYEKGEIKVKGTVAFAKEPEPFDLEGKVVETYTPAEVPSAPY